MTTVGAPHLTTTDDKNEGERYEVEALYGHDKDILIMKMVISILFNLLYLVEKTKTII